MDLKGSKTEKNLYTAFTGEAMAHTKYLIYSDKAKNEGFEQIGELFKYTAENELEHARIWFENLGFLSTTLNNLYDAKSGENFEWSKMYKDFANVAKDEGFTKIAKLFENIAEIEKSHEERYSKLLANIENNEVFSKSSDVVWECRNCGHKVIATSAPKICPVCKKEEAYFQVMAENY